MPISIINNSKNIINEKVSYICLHGHCTRHRVGQLLQGYNKTGVASIKCTPRGGRRRSLLSLEEEAALLTGIEQKAAKGLIKTANDIRVLVEAKTGKKVSDDYLYPIGEPRHYYVETGV